MNKPANTDTEKLQDALGLIRDEYIEEAHGGTAANGATAHEDALTLATAETRADAAGEKRPKLRVTGTQRTRTLTALAACLVIAAGIGLFALTSGGPLAGRDASEAPVATLTESAGAERNAGATDSDTETHRAAESAKTDTAPAAAGSAADTTAREAGSEAASTHAITGASIDRPELASGEAHVLTAAEWNDNANWPFFTNLVNSGAIAFPSFGIDPTHRVKATVLDATGAPARGETVELLDEDGTMLWRAKTDKEGTAYLFSPEGQTPATVTCNETSSVLARETRNLDDPQGAPIMQVSDEIELRIHTRTTADPDTLQVMFIVDTTGSMADEIAYLQKDFSSIASEVAHGNTEFSVNFYRDEGDDYVTRCNGFTNDVTQVQQALNKEYADGGGDAPEAVAQILDETITGNSGWRDECSKIAFLIFDAPPHEGTDEVLRTAVRSAAERGIRLVPVVASNADRETELFGRALSICTNGTYVFLTDDSGVGDAHLEPIVGDYTVEKLHDIIVRVINESR